MKGVGRNLRELVVVVAGILIAFTLDAWWDGRTEADHRQATGAYESSGPRSTRSWHSWATKTRDDMRRTSCSVYLTSLNEFSHFCSCNI